MLGTSSVYESLLSVGRRRKICGACNRHLTDQEFLVFEEHVCVASVISLVRVADGVDPRWKIRWRNHLLQQSRKTKQNWRSGRPRWIGYRLYDQCSHLVTVWKRRKCLPWKVRSSRRKMHTRKSARRPKRCDLWLLVVSFVIHLLSDRGKAWDHQASTKRYQLTQSTRDLCYAAPVWDWQG